MHIFFPVEPGIIFQQCIFFFFFFVGSRGGGVKGLGCVCLFSIRRPSGLLGQQPRYLVTEASKMCETFLALCFIAVFLNLGGSFSIIS